MALRKTVDNLKQKPAEDKRVVASGVAIAVVLVLFIGWGFLFLKKLRSGVEVPTISSPSSAANNVFDFSSLDEATRQFAESYSETRTQLEQIRDAAARDAAEEAPYDASGTTPPSSGVDSFGLPTQTDTISQ